MSNKRGLLKLVDGKYTFLIVSYTASRCEAVVTFSHVAPFKGGATLRGG
jgi:hypothetical protein